MKKSKQSYLQLMWRKPNSFATTVANGRILLDIAALEHLIPRIALEYVSGLGSPNIFSPETDFQKNKQKLIQISA